LNVHTVISAFGLGPVEAVNEFMKGNRDLVIDEDREKFLMTLNHKGYFDRV